MAEAMEMARIQIPDELMGALQIYAIETGKRGGASEVAEKMLREALERVRGRSETFGRTRRVDDDYEEKA